MGNEFTACGLGGDRSESNGEAKHHNSDSVRVARWMGQHEAADLNALLAAEGKSDDGSGFGDRQLGLMSQYLRQHFVFSGFIEARGFEGIGRCFKRHNYKPNETIVQAGVEWEHFCLIIDGSVVSDDADAGDAAAAEQKSAGGVPHVTVQEWLQQHKQKKASSDNAGVPSFGEQLCWPGVTPDATLRAGPNGVTVARIDANVFQALAVSTKTPKNQVAGEYFKQVLDISDGQVAELFRHMPSLRDSDGAMAGLLHLRELQAGERIAPPSAYLVIVASGECCLNSDDANVVRAGGYLKLADANDVCTARTESKVLYLTKDDYELFIPETAKHMSEVSEDLVLLDECVGSIAGNIVLDKETKRNLERLDYRKNKAKKNCNALGFEQAKHQRGNPGQGSRSSWRRLRKKKQAKIGKLHFTAGACVVSGGLLPLELQKKLDEGNMRLCGETGFVIRGRVFVHDTPLTGSPQEIVQQVSAMAQANAGKVRTKGGDDPRKCFVAYNVPYDGHRNVYAYAMDDTDILVTRFLPKPKKDRFAMMTAACGCGGTRGSEGGDMRALGTEEKDRQKGVLDYVRAACKDMQIAGDKVVEDSKWQEWFGYLEGDESQSLIGRGMVGCVYLVSMNANKPGADKAGGRNSPDTYFALKTMRKTDVIKKRQEKAVIKERDAMVDLNGSSQHPFLGTMLASWQTSKQLMMLLTFQCGGELYRIERTLDRRLRQDEIRFYMACVLSALNHMHDHGYVFRDLKGENVLIDNDGYAKLVDFGFTRKLSPSSRAHTVCGTPDYMAPEIIAMTSQYATRGRRAGYGPSVDYWALGVLTYEKFCKYSPFSNRGRDRKFHAIFANVMNPDYEPSWSRFDNYEDRADARSLIEQLLNRRESERLGFSTVVNVGNRAHVMGGGIDVQNHPFFEEIDFMELENRRLTPPFRPRDELHANGIKSYMRQRVKQPAKGTDNKYFQGWDSMPAAPAPAPGNSLRLAEAASSASKETLAEAP